MAKCKNVKNAACPAVLCIVKCTKNVSIAHFKFVKFLLCMALLWAVYSMECKVFSGQWAPGVLSMHLGNKMELCTKTVFRCLSPFKIGIHISLEQSVWAELSWNPFWKRIASICFGPHHSGKFVGAKFWFLKKLFSISPLKLGFSD